MESLVKIRLLGKFTVSAGRSIVFPTRKTGLLFAYLALNAGETISRERLRHLFWSDRGEAQAAGSLRRSLSDLRSVFGAEGITPPLLITTTTVTLQPETVSVDVLDFQEALQTRTAESDHEAAQIYQGELLAGIISPDQAFEDWLRVERARLHDMAVHLCEQLSTVSSAPEHLAAVEALAKRLVAIDPLCEEAHRALIRCYQRSGRRNAAIRQFARCSELLRNELDAEPEEQTKVLMEKTDAPVARRSIPAAESNRSDVPTDNRPSIAVLPLINMSWDPQETYFSDGITEDVITELARFSSLSVIARSSTFVFRDQSVDAGEVARSLGAQFLLGGSLRRSGERLRLTAQLVDADSKSEIWAERYDRTVSDVFAIQDELVHDVVSVLPGQIEASLRTRALRKPAENMLAYDHYLKALEHERQYTFESIVKGRDALKTAISLDPRLARAHALLAFFTFAEHWFLEKADSGKLEMAIELGQRAISLDPNDNDCFAKLGTAYLANCDYDQARHYLERSLEMNPHDCWSWSHYAWLLTTIGEHHKSLAYMDCREAIDPFPPGWHWETRGISEYSLGDYEQAVTSFRRMNPPGPWILGYLAACYGQLGQVRKAQDEWKHMLDIQPCTTVEDLFAPNSNTMRREIDVSHWLEGLQKAGITT